MVQEDEGLIQPGDPEYDREVDPDVIAKRHEFFEKYIVPESGFIDYLCVKYLSEPSESKVKEMKHMLLIHFYRTIEKYDESKYTGKKANKALKNWIHVVSKRFIYLYEMKMWHSLISAPEEVDVSEFADIYDVCIAPEHGAEIITDKNAESFVSDSFRYALRSLRPQQMEAFILQMQGYTVKEIREHHIKKGYMPSTSGPDAIKTMMHKARNLLKAKMQEYDNAKQANGTMAIQADASMPGYNSEDELGIELHSSQ